MHNTIRTRAAVLAVTLACGAPALWAQAMGVYQISGRIVSVDPANRMIQLDAMPGRRAAEATHPHEFLLASDVTILDQSRALSVSDLRAGTPVQDPSKLLASIPHTGKRNVRDRVTGFGSSY